MPFGQVVVGPPGAGKSTYCDGMGQLMKALKRPTAIVNLDPANDNVPYEAAIDINDLITARDVMERYGLGPNGALIYCMEYLEANMDWLEEQLAALKDDYLIIDIAGQVELTTNHPSLQTILRRLEKLNYRLVAIHLVDAYHITSPTTYISLLLLSLRTMLQLELPHLNVLSKMDLLHKSREDLLFNLDFYTDVGDLSHLLERLSEDPFAARFRKLNETICELVSDFGLVAFETVAIEDQKSVLQLLRTIDRANGYVWKGVERPGDSVLETAFRLGTKGAQHPDSSDDTVESRALQAQIAAELDYGPSRALEIQERWLDAKDSFDTRR